MAQSTLDRPRTSLWRVRAGFSLLEMLVVLVILVIVLSIVIPALSSARNAARRGATQTMMASVNTAIGQFGLSNRTQPGNYNPREMGAAGNTFSAMENLMLDLAGGVVPAADPPRTVTIDPPGAADPVYVDLGRIGASSPGFKPYFTPDPKFFVAQPSNLNKRAPTNTANAADMPVLVDAWGSPILAWVQDDIPAAGAEFASANASTRARFYRTSNEAFLRATSLGKLARNQLDDSLLSPTDANSIVTMEGLLGNPSFPVEPLAGTDKPAAARSSIVLHSAGVNGVYLGKEERGGKRSLTTGVQYMRNLDPIEGGAFDDVVIKAGE